MVPYDKKKPKYDKIKTPPADIPPCQHDFPKDLKLLTEYHPDLCEMVIEHGRQGYYIETFCGRYNICSRTMMSVWLNREIPEYKEFRSAVKTSISATLYFWNTELLHAIKNSSRIGDTIPVLRGIISDIMKSTPKVLRDLQFEDIEAPETPEQRKLRVDRENKADLFVAFKDGNNGKTDLQ